MSDLKNIIYRFPEGKFKALTMSYDDGALHDRRLVEIFNKYNIRGTFHLNSGHFGDGYTVTAEEVAALYRGHEVSSHTVSHPPIGISPITQTAAQIIDDRKALEQSCGYVVRGMSYPFGMANDEILAALPSCGIEYSRTVNSTHSFGLPSNFLLWDPTCHHSEALSLADDFIQYKKSWSPALFYVWGHSFEFEEYDNWNTIEAFCKKISNLDAVWYATNIEICDYINALHSLKFSARGDMVYNPSIIDVWINVDGVDIKLPSGKTVLL